MGVLRGFFQGQGSMVPTAVSQILEQVIHAIVSIIGAYVLLQYGKTVSSDQRMISTHRPFPQPERL